MNTEGKETMAKAQETKDAALNSAQEAAEETAAKESALEEKKTKKAAGAKKSSAKTAEKSKATEEKSAPAEGDRTPGEAPVKKTCRQIQGDHRQSRGSAADDAAGAGSQKSRGYEGPHGQ